MNIYLSNSELQEKTFSSILPTYVAIIMTNYFKLQYFNLSLRLFYCIISLFLCFWMASEQG